MKRKAFLLMFSLLSSQFTHAGNLQELRFDPVLDGVATGVGLTVGATLFVLRSEIGPKSCGWCELDSNGDKRVNDFDAWFQNLLRAPDPAAAQEWSDVLGYGIVPAFHVAIPLLTGFEAGWRYGAEDLVIVVEAFSWAFVAEQIFKYTVGRDRPHFTVGHNDPNDRYTSFVSGHATVGFALAVASGTVASLRNSPRAPLVWGVGLTLATTSSLMRLVSDRHYMTDVIGGAVLGTVLGYIFPTFFHGRKESNLSLVPEVHPERIGLRLAYRY